MRKLLVTIAVMAGWSSVWLAPAQARKVVPPSLGVPIAQVMSPQEVSQAIAQGHLATKDADTGKALVQASSPFLPAAGGCWVSGYQVGLNSYLGANMWRYKLLLNWCGNGSWITGNGVSAWAETYNGYSNAAPCNEASNCFIVRVHNGGDGQGYTFWYFKGHVHQCLPLAGCFNDYYPWVQAYGYPNGGFLPDGQA